MNGSEIINRVLQGGVFVPLLFAVSLVLIILIRTVGGVMRTSARERSRREIAAYIAEGTLSPEQGERLMRGGREEA